MRDPEFAEHGQGNQACSRRPGPLSYAVSPTSTMSTASYKNQVLGAMTEVLRPAGFCKSGSKFTRTLEEVVHLVSLQSSVSSTAQSLRLTVNLGVWLPVLASGAKPDVWSPHWRERLGFLMPAHNDHWWEISSENEAASASLEIAAAMKRFALPTFDTLSTVDALAGLWRAGKSPGLTEREARQYLEGLAPHSGAG